MNKIEIDTGFCGIKYEIEYFFWDGDKPDYSVGYNGSDAYVEICHVYKITNTWVRKRREKMRFLADSTREELRLSKDEMVQLEEIVLDEHIQGALERQAEAQFEREQDRKYGR